eukprot:341523_1
MLHKCIMFSKLMPLQTMHTFWIIILFLIVLVNCGFVRELPDLNSAWMELYAKNDWNGLADLYWTDCNIMPQNAPTLFGHDAVKNIFSAAKSSGIERVELHSGYAKQLAFDNGIDRGRYLFINKNDEIIDSGKYICWYKRVNEPNNKYPFKIKVDMFSSSVMQTTKDNKLDVNKDIMMQWSQAFLKCYANFDGIGCRNIVHDDILIKDISKREEYDKEQLIQYIENKYQVATKQITDYNINKIAQNKVEIVFNGNFKIDNAETKVNGVIIAWFDIVTTQVWRIDIDFKPTHSSKDEL